MRCCELVFVSSWEPSPPKDDCRLEHIWVRDGRGCRPKGLAVFELSCLAAVSFRDPCVCIYIYIERERERERRAGGSL